jgi:N-acetylglucosamine transport system substrate-binding protein
MMPPAVPGGKGDPTAIHLQTNTSASWFVSAKAKNPKGALDFLKFATTVDNARQSTRLAGSGTTVKGAWDAVTYESVKDAFAYLDKSKTIFNSRVWETRYPVMDKEYNVALYDLVTMKKTPQQFADYMESVAQKVRTDKDTVMLPLKLAK